MTALADPGVWGLVGLMVCALLLVLRRPLARLLRLLLRSSVGLGVLALFSQFSPLLGISLGVNCFNALVLGLLGVPGFGLLLMLRWLLQ